MVQFEITVFGQLYKVGVYTASENADIEDVAGYTDRSVHEIGIKDKRPEIGNKNMMKDQYAFMKEVLRHEIMHAAMQECGMLDGATFDSEQLADWYEIKAHPLHEIVVDAETKFDQAMREDNAREEKAQG